MPAYRKPLSTKFKWAAWVMILLAMGLVLLLLSRKTYAAREFPALAPVLDQFAAPGKEVARPATCAGCHREATEKWTGSHHSLANAPLSEEDRRRLLESRSPLLDQRNMNWVEKRDTLVLEEPGVPPSPVVGTIGITPLIQYLLLAPDGRIQTHDVAWDVEKREWFSVFEDEVEETPRIPGEWGHWTGQGMNWDANCAYCHMTNFEKRYDPVANTYDRTWDHMTITCTQCHPGMETHMSQVRNGNSNWKEGFTPRQIMETCATCHSRRDQLTADRFVAGDLYEDHFYLTTMETPGIYHPDGQVIGENYVYGSLTMSKMGTAGVTCMDCHDPHSADFILPVYNNALCQRCHGSGLLDAPRIDPLQHSHHPAESTGNLCVECHMPSTDFMGRDPRRDHSFSHPDPLLTIEMGIPNACSTCHNTQSVQWSLDYAEKWYGPDMNADRRGKARLMRDLFNGEASAPERLKLAVVAEKNRFWKATFVSMFQYIPFDEACYTLLLSMLDDPEPMVRSAAVRLLGAGSLPPEKSASLMADPVRGVRLSAALTVPGMTALPEGLEAELLAYMNHTADSPMGSIRLASFWMNHGDPQRARELARRAPLFDQHNPEAYRLAAIQLHSAGDPDGALALLSQALRIEPGNAQVHFNLGLLHAELKRNTLALQHLQAAVTHDPLMEDAWYNLVVYYWQMGQMAAAREQLTGALKALPQSPRLRQLARQMPPQAG